MAFENGVNWRPLAPNERGRHATFNKALEAAIHDLTTERNDFFDSLCDNWVRIFPDLPAKPGKYVDGKIFIFVRNASTSFMIRPKLRKIAAQLSRLPGAPKHIDLRLEIHAQ